MRCVGMTKQINASTPSSSMPSRKERLKVLLKLKSQRKFLVSAVAGLAAISASLAVVTYQSHDTPEIVKLGKGTASVEAQRVSQLTSYERGEAADTNRASKEKSIGSGEASFYGKELAGNRTANGEIFNPERLTAAHRTLPLGSLVRVTNPRNGEAVVVRINDRGPFHGDRVIDLSTAAARTIGLIKSGTGRVNLALLVN